MEQKQEKEQRDWTGYGSAERPAVVTVPKGWVDCETADAICSGESEARGEAPVGLPQHDRQIAEMRTNRGPESQLATGLTHFFGQKKSQELRHGEYL